MLKNFDQNLIQQCCDMFNEHMTHMDDTDINHIASYMVEGEISTPLEHILNRCSDDDLSLQAILQTIQACQHHVIQARMARWFQQNPPPYQQINLHLERFHHLSTSLLSIYEQAAQEQSKQAQPLQAKHEDMLLSSFITYWKQQEKIKCVNYYKGLPVQCTAIIEEIREPNDCYITVTLSHELLRVLAMTEQTSILTLNENDEYLIQLNTHLITQNHITFTSKNMAILKKRQQLRLQPTVPMEGLILQNKKVIGSGEIIDLSIKHIHIRMASHLSQPLQLKDMVDVHIQLNEHLVQGSALIRSIRPNPTHHVLHLEFLPNAKIQRYLQAEVASLQRKIIQEIREKSSPLLS